jgi:drug/metabolite transporter (DMT)-like permease
MTILTIILWVSNGSTEGTFIRFTNSLLTSFTLFSFMLLLTLFVYGDARKRPIAPLIGMLMSVLLGLGLTLFFLAQGELLMENNGSVRAQALSNTIRFGTTVIGLGLAMVIVAGTLFASLMNGPSQTIHFEEE